MELWFYAMVIQQKSSSVCWKKVQCVLEVAKWTRTGVHYYTVLDRSFNLRCEIWVNDFRNQPVLHEAYQWFLNQT